MTTLPHAAGTLVLATANPGKAREFAQLLGPLGFDLRTMADHGLDAPEETGLTFVENAILKARHVAERTGQAALADDSGLEVDALDGAPGIHSARYAGSGASDAENVARLLAALDGRPEAARGARFQCVIVYLRHARDPTPLICQGTWEGRILAAARGRGGFGYDPVFWVPGQACSAAELDAATKNRLSHRGQALRALLRRLGAADLTDGDG